MIQFGMTSAENMEKPKTKIFLEEYISVDYKIRRFSEILRSNTLLRTTLYICQTFKTLHLLFTCRLEIPAAEMTPNMIKNIPPMTGVGMVVKMAPILPSIPIKIMKTPLSRITVRLPTCCHKHNAI